MIILESIVALILFAVINYYAIKFFMYLNE